jgi:hypothetical protein
MVGCALILEIEMTMIRHTGNKKTIPTNISRERILSTKRIF